jgi:2-amino-4-hydroxy-6-hydroxymethyldihydropteridine diphosphokinase
MRALCYLGLGSNLRTPKRQLRQALNALKKLPRTTMRRTSCIESTQPLSHGYQPQYCNLVVELQTTLPPEKLHKLCIKIENKQKRVRKKRWGARTLDIDLLLHGNKRLSSKKLTIPHPRIYERPFVYQPLLELQSTIFEYPIKDQKSST